MKINVVKVISAAGTVLGLIGTSASGWSRDKAMEETVKKEVEKAILGFSRLRAKYGESIYEKEHLRLVIVGGYDPRLVENVEYADELNALAVVSFFRNRGF